MTQDIVSFQDIVDLFFEYNYVLYSDEYSGVHYGCDCGCGGDYYTDNPDAWNNMVDYNDSIIEKMIKLCDKLNIEYTGIGR